MRGYILTLIIFSLLPLCLMRPYIGVLVWSWIGYMNPHRLTWGFAESMPFVQIVAIVTIVGFVFTKDRQWPPLSSLTVVWALFLFWMTLSTMFALNEQASWNEWERVVKIQLMIFMTLCLINTENKINLLIWVIVLSIGFFGIKGGLFALKTGGNYLIWGPPNSFIQGNNEIALALLIVIPLFRYLQLQMKSKYINYMLLSFIALCGLSVFVSHSRGAFLAAIAMVLALVIKSRYTFTMLILVCIGGIALVNFMPDEWMARMQTISTYEEDRSAQGRLGAWQYAINLAMARPAVGGGFQAFTPELFEKYAPEVEDFADAHSIYFEVLAEQGFIGVFLFLLIGFMSYQLCRKVIKTTKEYNELQWANDLARMLQVSLVGYAVGGAFLGLAYFDLPYHVMAIVLILRRIVDKKVKEIESRSADDMAGEAKPIAVWNTRQKV